MSVAAPGHGARGAQPPAAGRYDLGIAGAGQLARMTCLAAWPLGVTVAVLGRPDEPAAAMAAGLVEGDWRDADAVRRLGAACAVVTLENEFVDSAALSAWRRDTPGPPRRRPWRSCRTNCSRKGWRRRRAAGRALRRRRRPEDLPPRAASSAGR